ncbi:hypothetical protein J7T55_008867 [Diaporthe amygdali]|uniref:uncharacterized protein n=1 Tax=Phomopsis amygdali TaxID=1214568 RepID=UPI0022FF0895|nr:uncharacterized protein J7T55_008867 [Diaporthe amygdali]KAJ0121700.1 hypothetical protein J7T55_008867 [Diaporthe amygdali]
MHFPFCDGKRRRDAKLTQRHPINWTPEPHGQTDTNRFLAGDVDAVADLTTLIARAGLTSARVPHLNTSGVVATSELLHCGNDESIRKLAEDQAIAQRRSQAARPWGLRSLFFSNASLIGEDFQQALMNLYGESSASSVDNDKKVSPSIACQGHWKLVYCSGKDCDAQHSHPEISHSGPPVTQKVLSVPVQADQRVSLTQSLEEELRAQEVDEGEEEFPFDAHLGDEAEYEQALCEVIAIASRPGSAKLVSLGRKKFFQSSGTVSAGAKKAESSDEERWSTQPQTGCPESESPRRVRLSLMGPPSGPPAIALPPNPPSPAISWPLRSGR